MKYHNFISSSELTRVLRRFNTIMFCDKWHQVMTSRIAFCLKGYESNKVTATYSLDNDGSCFTMNNEYLDERNRIKAIQGNSECTRLPTCQTVFFPSIGITAHYWILYISRDLSTMIVCTPFIVPPHKPKDNYGLYVLTKNPDTFWANKKLVKKIYRVLEEYKFKLALRYSGP